MNTREKLHHYGIDSIYHFTDKSNLKSIEKYGIQSLYNIEQNDIVVSQYGADTLSHTLDRNRGLDKFVHLAFIEDHPMYHVAKKRGSVITPIWIELDISILFDQNTQFCNAVANENYSNIFNINRVVELIDFKNIIQPNDFWTGVEARKAEIMAFESISLNKIKRISYGN